MPASAATFDDDETFLKKHVEVHKLTDKHGRAQVLVVPLWQGRVMTSTASGANGSSFGWINRALIASGKLQQHINVWGGEDRFWLGPEGGQFSIFFAKGVPFNLEHWFTPPAMDTEPFEVRDKDKESIRLRRDFTVTNYSGTIFTVRADREVRLLSTSKAWDFLGLSPAPNLELVAFESVNRLTNKGRDPWTHDTGLLSIWILGMFNPSPATTIAIPIYRGDAAIFGPEVNADYFGRVPPDRLKVKDGVVFFSGDGNYRSKIGISPRRAKPVMGSYDAVEQTLTIVQFTLPEKPAAYVNSMWEIQKDPFSGDVANSYNDGPAAPGATPLGPFFELESSSPAAALKPGKSTEHVHRTIHLQGKKESLDAVAKAVLGVGVDDIAGALKN